jgi:hypothetical protein
MLVKETTLEIASNAGLVRIVNFTKKGIKMKGLFAFDEFQPGAFICAFNGVYARNSLGHY